MRYHSIPMIDVKIRVSLQGVIFHYLFMKKRNAVVDCFHSIPLCFVS